MTRAVIPQASAFIILLLLCLQQLKQIDTKKFITQKKQETLMSKLEVVHQRNTAIRNYRGSKSKDIHAQNHPHHSSKQLASHGDDDVFEAIIMRTLIIRLFHFVEKSLKLSSHGLRMLGDTTAGLLSSLMRGVGGVMNIFATLMSKISDRVDHSIPKDPTGKALMIGDSRMNLVTTLKNIAKLISGFSHACIWGGEITESLTLGLGEAVQDSFKGLELITRAGNRAINFIFLNDYTTDQPLNDHHHHPNKTAHSLSHTINHMPDLVISEQEISEGTATQEPLSSLFSEQTVASTKRMADEVQAELAQLRKLGFSSSTPSTSSTSSVSKENIQHQSKEKKGSNNNNNNDNSDSHDQQRSISSAIRDSASDFSNRIHDYHHYYSQQYYNYNNHHHHHRQDQLDSVWSWCTQSVLWTLNSLTELVYHTWQQYTRYRDHYLHLLQTHSPLYRFLVHHPHHQVGENAGITQENMSQESTYFGMGTLSIHITLVFCLLWFISLLEFQSLGRKALFFFVLFLCAGLSIVYMEYQQRLRVITRVSTQTIQTYLTQQVTGFAYHPTNLLEDELFLADGHMHVISHTNQVWSQLSLPEKQQAENIAWANILLSSLWTLYDKELDIGGLGPYTNDMYEEMLTSELSNIPPGIANLRLKRFDLGTNPPFLKSIKGFTYRNHTCIRHLETSLHPEDPHSHTNSNNNNNNQKKSGFAAKFAEWEERLLLQHKRPSNNNHNNRKLELEDRYSTVIEHLLEAFASTTTSSSATATTTRRSNHHTKRHHKRPHSASTHSNSNSDSNDKNNDGVDEDSGGVYGVFDHFSIDCDRLYLDMDLVYASKDMDIVLSLRPSDLQSMVPEMAVTLSEVRLVGEVRLGIQMTHDYPFFGNATISFTKPPSFDFTLNSFGGLELTSIPLAFTFVNSSVQYMLRQYTYPHFTTVDLRHTVCPKCDQEVTRSVPEAIVASSQLLGSLVTQKLQNVRHFVQKTFQKVSQQWQEVSFVKWVVQKYTQQWKKWKRRHHQKKNSRNTQNQQDEKNMKHKNGKYANRRVVDDAENEEDEEDHYQEDD